MEDISLHFDGDPVAHAALHRLVAPISRETNRFGNQIQAFSESQDTHIIKTAFNLAPKTLIGFLEAQARLHQMGQDIYRDPRKVEGLCTEIASFFREQDVFLYSANQTSLLEIANFRPNPETGDPFISDIKKANSVFRRERTFSERLFQKSTPLSREHEMALSLVVFTAVQSNLYEFEAKSKMPLVANLQRNINRFFEVYSSFIMADSLSEYDETMLTSTIDRNFYLINGISGYLTAKFGLTPPSVMQIFRNKMYSLSTFSGKNKWARILPKLVWAVEYGYKEGNYLPELESYLLNTSGIGGRGKDILANYALNNPQDILDVNSRSFRLRQILEGGGFDRLGSIVKGRGRKLGYSPLPDLAEKAIVTQALINPKTVIFILSLDRGTSLTLEVDQKGNIYGLPTDLVNYFPTLTDQIFTGLLEPLVQAREKIELRPFDELRRLPVIPIRPAELSL
jgi:hypothetical protein